MFADMKISIVIKHTGYKTTVLMRLLSCCTSITPSAHITAESLKPTLSRQFVCAVI
jgi:hypothetical protein